MRIVHLSDFHYDGSPELRTALDRLVDRAIGCQPDLVVVSGDLSADGRPSQLDHVASSLARFGPVPRVVVPGNRDLAASAGPPGEAWPVPVDSDLDFFLALQPALGFGFAEPPQPAGADLDPSRRFSRRFGSPEAGYSSPAIEVVAVDSAMSLRSGQLEQAARRLRRAPDGAFRVFALHHGLLPVPGRKLRDGDLASRAGDIVALLLELKVDLVLHGHIHRAHAWAVSNGQHQAVVASAGALVNDGRRDASFNEIRVGDGTLDVFRRSVATGESTLLLRSTSRPRS